jgi:nucleoside-diphosphate-sugar epimerase
LPVDVVEAEESACVEACAGADAVFYLAAVAHERVARADAVQLRRVNVQAPVRWLRAADRAGVGRFVWLSSIKVLGDVSREPLQIDAPYRPGDPYARSKTEAERALLSLSLARTVLTVVRPPLVYGPGVTGNFRSLLRWSVRGLPLPLKGATAPRSMVGVDNLCDLLTRLAVAGNGIYHVADETDWTVADLITEIRRLVGLPPRLFGVPAAAVRQVAAAIGRSAAYERLFEPLRVDQSETRRRLGWEPGICASAQLKETVTWFLERP